MDGGDGCTTILMYLVPLNYTLKMDKILNFIFYNFLKLNNLKIILIF